MADPVENLLNAIDDPARYWEERCARAENLLVGWRQRTERAESEAERLRQQVHDAEARHAEALRVAANRVADLELTDQEVAQLVDSGEASDDWCDGWDAAVQQAEIAVLLPAERKAS